MVVKYYECDICGHNHPWDWDGDCRDDANRFTEDELCVKHGLLGYDILTMDERLAEDTA